MLENGFGEHNIQGIGDKHIPLIHNVMNTDVVVGGQRPGDRRARRAVQHRRRPRLPRRPQGRAADVVDALAHFGLSSICNVLAAIKTAKLLDLGARRRHRSPSPPTARRCTRASGRKIIAARLRRRVHRPRRRRGVSGEHLADVATDAHASSAPSATARGSSTSATTRGSSSRARRSSCSRRAARRRSGAACAATSAVWDEMITEFNASVAAG